MSSSSFSNLRVSLPFAPERISTGSKNLHRLPGRSSHGNGGVKAMVAGEGGDNLDHLRRASNHQSTQSPQPQPQPQPQPKRRIAPIVPIGRLWSGFPTARTVQQIIETMERMMMEEKEDPFAYSSTWPSPSLKDEEEGYRGGGTPWEIKEGKQDYKMRFDMPGMTKNDVNVWVEDKMLVFKVKVVPNKKNKEVEASDVVVKGEGEEEWSGSKSYGSYSSRIALPDSNIEIEKIKAEVKDGVLYVTIPKASSSAKVLGINVQ